MSRARTVSRYMDAPGHLDVMRRCTVMTEVAIHTVTLEEGSFAAIVTNNDIGMASIQILDRDDVEAQIRLMRNAIEDAERIDAGKAPIHAAPTSRRQ